MKLQEIRKRAETARQLLKKINPPISCYLVVMINRTQFIPSGLELGMDNCLELTRHSEVFLPGQDLKIMNTRREEMEALAKEIESLEKEMKKIRSGIYSKVMAQFDPRLSAAITLYAKRHYQDQDKEEVGKVFAECEKTLKQETKTATEKTEKMVEKCNEKLHSLFNTLKTALEAAEFHEPLMELRFDDLDMEKIQQLKAHPLVQAIGKTDMSPASIRVVVG